MNETYVAYQLKELLNLKNISNETIAKCIAAFFFGQKLEKSVEILNLTLLEVLKDYRNDKAWTEREEKKFKEDLEYARKKMLEADKSNHLFREE